MKNKKFVFIGTSDNYAHEPKIVFVMACDEDEATRLAMRHIGRTDNEIEFLMGEATEEKDDDTDYAMLSDLSYQIEEIPMKDEGYITEA